jgi:hypothetical protein
MNELDAFIQTTLEHGTMFRGREAGACLALTLLFLDG